MDLDLSFVEDLSSETRRDFAALMSSGDGSPFPSSVVPLGNEAALFVLAVHIGLKPGASFKYYYNEESKGDLDFECPVRPVLDAMDIPYTHSRHVTESFDIEPEDIPEGEELPERQVRHEFFVGESSEAVERYEAIQQKGCGDDVPEDDHKAMGQLLGIPEGATEYWVSADEPRLDAWEFVHDNPDFPPKDARYEIRTPYVPEPTAKGFDAAIREGRTYVKLEEQLSVGFSEFEGLWEEPRIPTPESYADLVERQLEEDGRI